MDLLDSFRFGLKLLPLTTLERIYMIEVMKTAEKPTPLETRVSWAIEHWRSLLSQMPPRNENGVSQTRTSDTQNQTSKQFNASKELTNS